MGRVLDTLLFEHDLRLVVLAAVICAVGAASTMNVSGRAAGTRRAGLWLVLLSLCAGATVWSTHFIAMLAYLKGVPMTYDPGLTALSFAAGTAVMGMGFAVAVRGGRSRRERMLGGAVLGLGVVILHYLGMAAVRLPGHLTWEPGLVVASVLLSVGFGAPSLLVAFGRPRPNGPLVAAVLMIAMVVSLHFTAMGAAHVHHGLATGGAVGGVSRPVLAAAIALASVIVLLIGVAGATLDRRVSHRLAAEADRFRTLADGAFEGLIIHRNGVIVDANAAARRLFGLTEEPGGATIHGWFDLAPGVATSVPGPGGEGEATEVVLHRPDGTRFPAEICRRRILLTDGVEGELFSVRDLTARKESEARIAHLALHDPLTELPNRRFFMELAGKSLSLAQRQGDRLGLLAIDLDNFKWANDLYGHPTGDEVLRITAQRIADTVRASDLSARFGGDEFVVLHTTAGAPSETIALAERLLEALCAPIELGGVAVELTASIGVAVYPDDGRSLEQLLRCADTAMYRAKADGKSTCRFFEPQMDQALVARRRLESGLRQAVAEDRLTVLYQPIVDGATRQPVAFEALVRWEDDELGPVRPGDFIPVAEESGLIVAIGESVLRRACRDAAAWPDSLAVAVNLSPVQFRRRGLVETVRRALAESGLPGERLELEVTETLLMDSRDDVLVVLNQLRELGVRIAMDDFGTGYSSLRYLQSFPFDKLKIDQVFIYDLPTNAQNASIVRAVAALGKSLRMRTVAEGVETDLQARMLQGLDVDEIQGYLIGHPMPVADIHRFLETWPGLSPEREATVEIPA